MGRYCRLSWITTTVPGKHRSGRRAAAEFSITVRMQSEMGVDNELKCRDMGGTYGKCVVRRKD